MLMKRLRWVDNRRGSKKAVINSGLSKTKQNTFTRAESDHKNVKKFITDGHFVVCLGVSSKLINTCRKDGLLKANPG